MMNNRTITILGIACCGQLLAQTSTSDCDGAIQLCGGIYTEASAPLGTGDLYEFTGICNANLETSSLWYVFTVQNAGDLSFILDPANDADDYDWGLFNITNGGCAGINAQDGTSPEVNCNSYGSLAGNGPTGISTANGGVGVTNGPGDLNGPPFNANLPVQVGETYALVVMNWSGSPDGYSIDFTESTASIYDDSAPTIVSVTTDCSNQTFTVQFSEPIVISSVTPSDFTMTSPSGGVLSFTSATPIQPSSSAASSYSMVLSEAATENGTHTFTITNASGNVQDLCGNSVLETTFEVPLVAPVTYTVDITTACNGTGGTLQATYVSGGTAPVTFTLAGSVLPPSGLATDLGPGDYGFWVNDAAGCQITDVVTIPDHLVEVLIPQEQDSLSCSRTAITIEGVSVLPEQAVQYTWTAVTAEGTDSTFSTSATPVVTQPGIYTVFVTDTQDGCTDEASIVIHPTAVPTVDLNSIKLPNVISPNGDGENDVWRPFLPDDPEMDVTTLFETYKLAIYNRWGQLIHDDDGGKERTWKATDATEGTYFYSIAYRAECGAVIDQQLTGSIIVLR